MDADPVTIIDRELARTSSGTATRVRKAHRTYVLNARKVMDYLRAHPGATNDEIREATGHSPARLQRMGVAKWRREDGRVRWYLTDKVARTEKEEREEPEPRFVRYTNV